MSALGTPHPVAVSEPSLALVARCTLVAILDSRRAARPVARAPQASCGREGTACRGRSLAHSTVSKERVAHGSRGPPEASPATAHADSRCRLEGRRGQEVRSCGGWRAGLVGQRFPRLRWAPKMWASSPAHRTSLETDRSHATTSGVHVDGRARSNTWLGGVHRLTERDSVLTERASALTERDFALTEGTPRSLRATCAQ